MAKGKHNDFDRHDITLPDGSTMRILVYRDKPWVKIGVWDKTLNVWDIRSGKAANGHHGSHVFVGYADRPLWGADAADEANTPDE
jgi:hypothetical protein